MVGGSAVFVGAGVMVGRVVAVGATPAVAVGATGMLVGVVSTSTLPVKTIAVGEIGGA